MTEKITDHPRSFRFNDTEFELLSKLAIEYGSGKAAIMAGLHKLDSDKITKAQVIAWLESLDAD